MQFTGKDILALGIKPGPHIRPMIERANTSGVCTYESLRDLLPPPPHHLRPRRWSTRHILSENGETMSRFLDQFALCEKDDEIIYHVGFHCVDHKGKRNAAARDAWKAYENGDVLLYQRRVGFDQLAYCAKVIR